VLALYSADATVFQPSDLGVLLWIREDLARAVKRALAPDRLDPAACDILTGLPNERGLFERLDAMLMSCRGGPATLAVLVVELNGLAEVGARFGEAALSRLVQAIGSGLRADLPARRLRGPFRRRVRPRAAGLSGNRLRRETSLRGCTGGGHRLGALRGAPALDSSGGGLVPRRCPGRRRVAGYCRQPPSEPAPGRLAEELARLSEALCGAAATVGGAESAGPQGLSGQAKACPTSAETSLGAVDKVSAPP